MRGPNALDDPMKQLNRFFPTEAQGRQKYARRRLSGRSASMTHLTVQRENTTNDWVETTNAELSRLDIETYGEVHGRRVVMRDCNDGKYVNLYTSHMTPAVTWSRGIVYINKAKVYGFRHTLSTILSSTSCSKTYVAFRFTDNCRGT